MKKSSSTLLGLSFISFDLGDCFASIKQMIFEEIFFVHHRAISKKASLNTFHLIGFGVHKLPCLDC